MRQLLLILFSFLSASAFSQKDDILIQNFYQSCKSEKYSAFNAVNKGIQLFETKQYSRSMNNFKKALELDPDYCDAWYLIAYCYQKNGELDNAINACDKALEIAPNSPSALIVKANTKYLKGEILNAIELFIKSKELLPDKIDGYYGLALMLHYDNKNEDALKILAEMEVYGVKTINIKDNRKINNLKKKLIELR